MALGLNNNLDLPPHTFVGRRVKPGKKYLIHQDNKVRVLFLAFKENRPGGTSVDVLWEDPPQPKSSIKSKVLVDAAAVCAIEKFSVVGLAMFKVQHVLNKVRIFSNAVKSENATNKQHGDLIPAKWHALESLSPDLTIEEVKRIRDENEVKAIQLAKALADYHFEHGSYVEFTEPLVVTELLTQNPELPAEKS